MPNYSRMLMVVDGEGDPEGSRKLIKQYLSFDGWKAVVPNPDIERLGLDRTALHRQQADRRLTTILKAAEALKPSIPVPVEPYALRAKKAADAVSERQR